MFETLNPFLNYNYQTFQIIKQCTREAELGNKLAGKGAIY